MHEHKGVHMHTHIQSLTDYSSILFLGSVGEKHFSNSGNDKEDINHYLY